MGANAQTTVQKFVDGAVLTAAQQNFSAATGVPVFATTVTRDAAFGGANKVLAEARRAIWKVRTLFNIMMVRRGRLSAQRHRGLCV